MTRVFVWQAHDLSINLACVFFHPLWLALLTPAASLHIASGSLTFTPLNKRFMEIAVEMSEYTRRDGAALSGAALKALIVPGSSLSLAKDGEAFTAFTRAMVQTGGCCVSRVCLARAYSCAGVLLDATGTATAGDPASRLQQLLLLFPLLCRAQDADLFGGTSGASSTYGNVGLSQRMEFECMSLEVWAFKPRGF